jgi:multiple sugar transport system substrate-binding protein
MKLSSTVLALSFLLGACAKGGGPTGADAARAGSLPFEKSPVGPILFLSTQLNPVEEAGKMRGAILAGFPGKVDFRPNDSSYFLSQIDDLLRRDPGASMVLGALHGEFAKLHEEGRLRNLDDVYQGLEGRGIATGLVDLGRLDGKHLYYIPWMQASYLMAINKKALKYLPRGVDVRALTYEQLYDWSVAILAGTGKFVLGFPAGEKGLMHRFLQGYLYPSFTGSTLAKFRGSDAAAMWTFLKKLWRVVQPGSLGYSTMADPLLAGDVWIAWDHSARLIKVFESRPDDFIAVPAPAGPKGLGFMAVVSGLGIPTGAAASADAALLIDYLTRPEVQTRTLEETGFFPVTAATSSSKASLRELTRAIEEQAASAKAIPTLLPVGLGERGDRYNSLFMLTFSDIVLGGMDIGEVLDANAAKLQQILVESKAALWAPDKAAGRPGKLE